MDKPMELFLVHGLSAVEAAEAKLRPVAGGTKDGTTWDTGHDAATPILEHFAETLDKLHPGQLDISIKALKKARHLNSQGRQNHIHNVHSPVGDS